MQFADKIKNVPVILIVISLATVIYITEHINGFTWYWIIFPIALPLLSAILQLAGKLKSQITPIAGAITSVLPIPFYLESLTPVSGSDGQAALIFAVIPVYQLLGLVILSLAGYTILAWKKKHHRP